MTPLEAAPAPPTVWTGMARGVRGLCPNCGEGRLFPRYLKVQAICPVCSHDNGQLQARTTPRPISPS